MEDAKVTTLTVTNEQKDRVALWVTLGFTPGHEKEFVTDVHGIFGIANSGKQGYTFLFPDGKLSYTPPDDKALQATITFGARPSTEPDPDFPNGINLFECTINNWRIKDKPDDHPQETIDISCVDGLNCKIKCDLIGGPAWNAGLPKHHDIIHIENNALGHNKGQEGVFPADCSDCIKNDHEHGKWTPQEDPQTERICTVQRDALEGKCTGDIVIHYCGML